MDSRHAILLAMKRGATIYRSLAARNAPWAGFWAASLLLLLALSWSGPVGATEIAFPSKELQTLTSLHRGGSLFDDFQPLPLIEEELHHAHENPQELIEDIIMSENWLVWLAFQAHPSLAVPLAEAQLYIVESDRVAKRPKVQERRYLPKESRVSDQQGPEEPQQLQRAFIAQEQSLRIGLLKLDIKPPPSLDRGAAGLLSWLLEDEGVFSGRPWSWDNFLPRVLSVAGLVLGALMAVEFLHLVVALGVRTLGRSRGVK
jgi:hypothetical protein